MQKKPGNDDLYAFCRTKMRKWSGEPNDLNVVLGEQKFFVNSLTWAPNEWWSFFPIILTIGTHSSLGTIDSKIFMSFKSDQCCDAVVAVLFALLCWAVLKWKPSVFVWEGLVYSHWSCSAEYIGQIIELSVTNHQWKKNILWYAIYWELLFLVAPVPVKLLWRQWVNVSHESTSTRGTYSCKLFPNCG